MNNPTSKIADIKTVSADDYLKLLKDYKDKVERISGKQHQEFISAMESLWLLLTSIENTQIVADLVSNEQLVPTRRFLSAKWHEYISLIETNIAKKFLQADVLYENSNPSALSEEDYTGVEKELSLLTQGLSHCTIAMIGCGPFPETLMEIFRKNRNIKIAIGVEEKPEVAKLANAVIKKALPGVNNIEVRTHEAESLNYSDFDVVFLANGLVNKGAILRQINATIKNTAEILARNPILMGKILYEDLRVLPQVKTFDIPASVQASKLSETLLLKKSTTSTHD